MGLVQIFHCSVRCVVTCSAVNVVSTPTKQNPIPMITDLSVEHVGKVLCGKCLSTSTATSTLVLDPTSVNTVESQLFQNLTYKVTLNCAPMTVHTNVKIVGRVLLPKESWGITSPSILECISCCVQCAVKDSTSLPTSRIT